MKLLKRKLLIQRKETAVAHTAMTLLPECCYRTNTKKNTTLYGKKIIIIAILILRRRKEEEEYPTTRIDMFYMYMLIRLIQKTV